MTDIPVIPIPHIDPSLYAWREHPAKPGLYQRRALGLETKWVHQNPMNRQLFLSGTITLPYPFNLSEFHNASKVAWLRLRFQFPEVVLKFSGEFGSDGSAVMECQIPNSEPEAEDWAARTLFVGSTTWGADGKLSAEAAMRKEEVNDPVCTLLNLIVTPNSHSKAVSGAQFCFRMDHQLVDGMGVYILAGYFFKFLAEALGDRKQSKNEWSRASENIPEPWIRIMNAYQKTEGEDFEANVKRNAELVLESFKSEWGLKVNAGDGYEPASIQKIFSADESRKILRSVKSEIGPAASVTHLGHAAMAMTVLKFNPVQDRPSSNRFVSGLFMSGRRYLDSKQPKSTEHVPMCRAVGAIDFRDVDRYVLSEDANEEEVNNKLKVACEEARRSYQAIRHQDSLLSESFAITEFMGTAKNAIRGKGTIEPLFLSDGIVEQYVSRTYADTTGATEVLVVDDVKFTANPDGLPVIIRMYTFRDTIRVAAEWNKPCYPADLVRRFLDSITSLMLSLA